MTGKLRLVIETALYRMQKSPRVRHFSVDVAYHCGMYIPLSDDKNRFVRNSSRCALETRDNI